MLGYSLEEDWRGASKEYPQHIFLWRNKKNINKFCLKKNLIIFSPSMVINLIFVDFINE